jgi:predicted NUDIX family phosphoesterase
MVKTVDKNDEIILVVHRNRVFESETLVFDGAISRDTNSEKINKIVGNIGEYAQVMRRGDAEESVNYKQPIPYAFIRRGNEIFVYKRLTGGGEKRLHEKLSLGVGGHMNKEEKAKDFFETLQINLERELGEELNINTDNLKLDAIGLINDDSNDVGKVHIGLLVAIDVPKGTKVTVKETDQLEGSFLPIKELSEPHIYNKLENWSKIVVDFLGSNK